MQHTSPLPQHPLRLSLHNEVHARPPEAMEAPQVISRVVMLCDEPQRLASRDHLAKLLRDHHLPLPDANATHLRLEFPGKPAAGHLGAGKLRRPADSLLPELAQLRQAETIQSNDLGLLRALGGLAHRPQNQAAMR